jgi:hypothetical protein
MARHNLCRGRDRPRESTWAASSTSQKKPAAKQDKRARSQTGPNNKSTDAAAKKSTKETKSAWPKKLPEQIAAVRQALQSHKGPAAPDIIASRFRERKGDILNTVRHCCCV